MLKRLEEIKEKVNKLYEKYDKKIKEFELRIEKLEEEKRVLKAEEIKLKNNLEFDESRNVAQKILDINKTIKAIEEDIKYIEKIKISSSKNEKLEILNELMDLDDELVDKTKEKYIVIDNIKKEFEIKKEKAIGKVYKEYEQFHFAIDEVEKIKEMLRNE